MDQIVRCEGGGCAQPAAQSPFFDFRGQGYSVQIRRLCVWCAYAIKQVRNGIRGAARAHEDRHDEDHQGTGETA